MLRRALILLFAAALVSPGTLLAYTVYSDMAGSEENRVWAYSHTELAGEDWHYHSDGIYQTLRDPNGQPTSGWGDSISVAFTAEGNYNVLARHELYCTLHNAHVTPYSSSFITITASMGVYYLVIPGDWVAAYHVCQTEPREVICSSLAVFQNQRPPGVSWWPMWMEIWTMNATVWPGPTVCYIVLTMEEDSCPGG